MELKLVEKREFPLDGLEVEVREDSPPVLKGHAAVFNKLSDNLGWFREKIEPGAFMESIGKDDVRALFNHDPNIVLGRNKAGTLELSEDKKGLAVKIIPPDTQIARDVITSIERGDVSQMSFAFVVEEDKWEYGEEGKPDIRTVMKARLFDVSPVTYPAYPQTDIKVAQRSHEEWKKREEENKNVNRFEYFKRRLNLHERA